MIKDYFLSQIRNQDTSRPTFRHAAHQLAYILATETGSHLETEEITLETPLAATTGYRLTHRIILIPIMRSGIALLPAFLSFFNDASVGFVGLQREEHASEAEWYYCNIPTLQSDDRIIILDPTIATGGSAIAALAILKDRGISEERIIFATILSCTRGIDAIKSLYPHITILSIAEDEKLNALNVITPGIGDFGDRYFGTEE